MEELRKLRLAFENEFLTREEFDKRRISIIDAATHTSGEKVNNFSLEMKIDTKAGVTAPTGGDNSRYAGKYFDQTNSEVYDRSAYLVVTAPVASNRHLFTSNVPDNSYSYITAPVPVDPKRAYKQEIQSKVQGNQRIVFQEQAPGAADRYEMVNKLEQDKKKLGYELFNAAATNNAPLMKELLDMGGDVNQRDHDSENTPLITACAKGQKHAAYYLVERGADVNARNVRGETALHEAVKMRFNELALWLTKLGADIHVENYRGYSPYDLALPWLQVQLRNERDHFLQEKAQKLAQAKQEGKELTPGLIRKMEKHEKKNRVKNETPMYEERFGVPVDRRHVRAENGAMIEEVLDAYNASAPKKSAASAVTQENVKIYFSNGMFRQLVISSDDTARDVADLVAERLRFAKYSSYLELIEKLEGEDKKLDQHASVLALKKKWPLLLGPSGNETDLHCRFLVVPKRGTPEPIVALFNSAINAH